MSLRKIFFVVCLIISVLCLAAGYALAGKWFGAIAAILISAAWLLARKYPAAELPLVCLLASVGLAVAGTLVGAFPLWMIFSSAFALAAWDLLLLDTAVRNNSSLEPTHQYEFNHLQSLALAIGLGLFAILLGRFLRIQIPFLGWVLFIGFVLFALDRVWGYIKNIGKP